MPSYTLENMDTKEQKDVIMSWSELEDFIKENPEWKQIPGAPKIISGAKGVHSQTSDGFRDVLRGIKKANRGSNIYVK